MLKVMDAMIPINEQLFHEAELLAAKRGLPVPVVINTALRDGLERQKREADTKPFGWPILDLGPPLPGVDLNNSAALLDLMEEDDGPV